MSTIKFRYYIFSILHLLREFSPRSHVLRVFLKLPYSQNQIIRLVRSDLGFYIRGAMDIWTIKETFVDRFYEKYGSPVKNNWTVVDIGAGIGDFSIFCAYRHQDSRIFSFEPTPESYQLFEKNLAVNKISNIKPSQQAIWSTSGEISINTDHAEPGQFTSQPIQKWGNSQSSLKVSSLTLEEVVQSASIDTIHLLKLDCEGAEFPILFNTPEYVYSRIERVVMEYHDSIVETTHQDLAAFLESKGYIVSTYPNFVHSNLGYLYAFRREIVNT
jgi:FkbM family methyltransferase